MTEGQLLCMQKLPAEFSNATADHRINYCFVAASAVRFIPHDRMF